MYDIHAKEDPDLIPGFPRITIRQCLQYIGTDIFRKFVDDRIWSKLAVARITSDLGLIDQVSDLVREKFSVIIEALTDFLGFSLSGISLNAEDLILALTGGPGPPGGPGGLVIITDFRFPGEFTEVKHALEGIANIKTIRIIRENQETILGSTHSSECALDSFETDLVIQNNGVSLDRFEDRIRLIHIYE